MENWSINIRKESGEPSFLVVQELDFCINSIGFEHNKQFVHDFAEQDYALDY